MKRIIMESFNHIVLKVLDKGSNGKHGTVEWII